MTPDRVRRSLGAKLLLGELLVILAGAATLLITALSIGPAIFHHHVRDALGTLPADVARHLDDAFGESTLIALGIATAAAVVAALVVSWIVSRRVSSGGTCATRSGSSPRMCPTISTRRSTMRCSSHLAWPSEQRR